MYNNLIIKLRDFLCCTTKSNMLTHVIVQMNALSPRWKIALDNDNESHFHPLCKYEVEYCNYFQCKYELRSFDRGSCSTHQVLGCHSSGRLGCNYCYEPRTNKDSAMCKRSTGVQHHALLQGQGRLCWSCVPLFNAINNAINHEDSGLYLPYAQLNGETNLVSFECRNSSKSIKCTCLRETSRQNIYS